MTLSTGAGCRLGTVSSLLLLLVLAPLVLPGAEGQNASTGERSYVFDEREGWLESDVAEPGLWWQDYEPVDRSPDPDPESDSAAQPEGDSPIADWRLGTWGWESVTEADLSEDDLMDDERVIPWGNPYTEDNTEQLLEQKELAFEDDY